MEDLRLALQTGIDIPIPVCQLTIHQPTISEISCLGEFEYLSGVQSICLTAPKDKPEFESISDFQIFMTMMHDKGSEKIKQLVLDVFVLFFPKYTVNVAPRALLFNNQDNTSIIDENNFSSFQEVIRQVGCIKVPGASNKDFNPANSAAAEIARKLERGRQRVAAQKQANQETGSVISRYLSILCVALHISLKELCAMTLYQLYDIVERYTLYLNWDLDIRSRLAGGAPDKQPEDWMKIIQ